jgi:DNA-binding MarR family transcriptional regulator
MNYDDLATEFLRNMRAVGIAKRQRFLQEGVQGESLMLNFIMEKGGEAIPGKMSEALEVSSARVAAALNSLESKGMITREIDSEDRRRIIVKLTDNGRKRAEEQRKIYIEQVKKLLAALGDHDAKEYVRILGKTAKLLSGVRDAEDE